MGEIDDEIYGLHCDIGRLEMENADLRSENDKLQKLLHVIAYCADDHADCDQCPMNGKPHAPVPVPQAFCDEMAELLRQHGVEVD